MVVTIWIGVSMYGLRAGNVVRRMFWLTSPMLAKRAVFRCAAGQSEIVILRHQHAMQVDYSRSGVSGMSCGHVPIRALAVYSRLAGGDVDGVG